MKSIPTSSEYTKAMAGKYIDDYWLLSLSQIESALVMAKKFQWEKRLAPVLPQS